MPFSLGDNDHNAQRVIRSALRQRVTHQATWGGTWIAQRTAPPTSSNPHKARPQK